MFCLFSGIEMRPRIFQDTYAEGTYAKKYFYDVSSTHPSHHKQQCHILPFLLQSNLPSAPFTKLPTQLVLLRCQPPSSLDKTCTPIGLYLSVCTLDLNGNNFQEKIEVCALHKVIAKRDSCDECMVCRRVSGCFLKCSLFYWYRGGNQN